MGGFEGRKEKEGILILKIIRNIFFQKLLFSPWWFIHSRQRGTWHFMFETHSEWGLRQTMGWATRLNKNEKVSWTHAWLISHYLLMACAMWPAATASFHHASPAVLVGIMLVCRCPQMELFGELWNLQKAEVSRESISSGTGLRGYSLSFLPLFPLLPVYRWNAILLVPAPAVMLSSPF